MLDLNQHIFPKILLFPLVLFQYCLLRATRGARNPNLQAVTTHESHVCSQYSFGLLLLKNEWNAQNAISSRAFGPSITRNLITRVDYQNLSPE